MTSISVWAGVDTRGVASVYVASDSRISWRELYRWDQGRKVFACNSKPHIFGYWGDTLFATLALPVLADRIDRDLLARMDLEESDEIGEAILLLWNDYPVDERRNLGIIHSYRTGHGTDCVFHLTAMTYDKASDSWDTRKIPMPSASAMLEVAGSGAKAVNRSLYLWQLSQAAGTSRAIFSAFCESVTSQDDPYTGGAPQLAGLYRIGPGRLFGIAHNGNRYFAGTMLADSDGPGTVEWRNHLFERVDGSTGERVPGAQRHEDRPRGSRRWP